MGSSNSKGRLARRGSGLATRVRRFSKRLSSGRSSEPGEEPEEENSTVNHYMEFQLPSPKPDPRQEELKQIESDPDASAKDVMRARVRSRRFDLNMHLSDDEEEFDDIFG